MVLKGELAMFFFYFEVLKIWDIGGQKRKTSEKVRWRRELRLDALVRGIQTNTSQGQPGHSLVAPLVPSLRKLPGERMCGCAALVAGARPPRPVLPRRLRRRRGSSVRAEVSPGGESQPKKVTVAGAGWAGFAAAHHLIKQVGLAARLRVLSCEL